MSHVMISCYSILCHATRQCSHKCKLHFFCFPFSEVFHKYMRKRDSESQSAARRAWAALLCCFGVLGFNCEVMLSGRRAVHVMLWHVVSWAIGEYR